jgi:hypothetical protein
MIDDPLSLLSLGIWLMAAGMWPVGFLFGACSACCDEECPGSLCHFHEFAGYAFRPVILYPNVSITVSIDSVSTNSLDFDTNWIDIGTNNVSITGIYQTFEQTVTSVSYRYMIIQSGDGSCGLTDITARYYIRFQALFLIPELGQLIFETPDSATEPFLIFESGECAPFSVSDLEFSELPWSSLGTGETLEDNLVDYLNDLVGTVSISFDACECGACCRGVEDAPAACLENVVSHLCDTDPSEQLWRGDGTTCEEEDCNSGACCDSEGNCYPVYSEDYCGGFFVPGVTCEDNPCDE